MKVLQILPELIQGGVERGTLDLARELVRQGHESHVISAGGPLVDKLQSEGSAHHSLPVHRKSLLSLRYVKPLRELILSIDPDVIHVRSRLPAWLNFLALRKLPKNKKPAVVSTVHGLYSVNRYSEIMTRADRVIAISSCVSDYITRNYPRADRSIIRLVHRAVDPTEFPEGYQPSEEWKTQFFAEFPQLSGEKLILFPGRITRWKGHKFLLDLMESLSRQRQDVHGIVVGSAHASKSEFYDELLSDVNKRQLEPWISFLGNRRDMKEIYAVSSLALNLSDQPEPFGRTVIEALKIGLPVVAWDQGGPAEVLRLCYPQGLVNYPDVGDLAKTVDQLLDEPGEINFSSEFTLDTLVGKTLNIYDEVVSKSLSNASSAK